MFADLESKHVEIFFFIFQSNICLWLTFWSLNNRRGRKKMTPTVLGGQIISVLLVRSVCKRDNTDYNQIGKAKEMIVYLTKI